MPLPRNELAYVPPYLHAYPGGGKFSWSSELQHLTSRKFISILWWPVFTSSQRWFTQSDFFLSCKKLPEFYDLWKTIQKGAFAYNTLFFRMTPLRRSATDLADITTLALFFGDEFIDGIATTAGKPFIRGLVKEDPELFYMQVKIKAGKVILTYRFNLPALVPASVMQEINPKYEISYQRFYEILQYFLRLINEYIGRLPKPVAEKAAYKIADACNTCIESFLHDVNSCPVPGSIREVPIVQHFHELKTAYMQKKLLELRCILVGKEEVMSSTQASGWLDIMRVVQIYDDIHDPVIDDGVQDNILLSIACHYFPKEWEWFCANKQRLEKEDNRSLLFSLYMPCSMEHCLQLASSKITTMNWEQQKIMHYLIFKNNYVLYKENADQHISNDDDFLLRLYLQVKDKMTHLPPQAIKSYVINTCVHLRKERKQLLDRLNHSERYQLRYNLLSLSPETKANIFDSVTTNL
ncbi:MAG: hypothetical protein E6H09_20680 [Bacteroidetes bacterium]|nr:MAG: hypothetical protein E6H09_20680 [Bacteroidota bacterium]